MNHELADLRTELTAAERLISEARATRDAAQTALDDAETAYRAAHTTASSLRRQITELERQPHAASLYQQRLDQLRTALRNTPATSPTGQRVRLELTRLESSQAAPSDRAQAITGLLKDVRNYYQLDREVWDAATPGIAGREPGRRS